MQRRELLLAGLSLPVAAALPAVRAASPSTAAATAAAFDADTVPALARGLAAANRKYLVFADATRACAMAKRLVTDTAFRVANDALQLLGGYGYLSDYGIEKIVRDLRVHRILEGTNEIMRLIVARNLLGR